MRSPARTHSPLNGRPLGLLLVACAIAFNAFFLAPELRISRAPLNDLVFHRAASERLEASLEHGEPFLDPWVSEWSLGYPLWRSYQPLAHLLGALVLRFGRSFGEPSAVFAALLYGGGAAPGAQVSVASVMATCAAAGLGLRDLPSPLERRLLTGRASPEARSRSVPSSPRARSAG